MSIILSVNEDFQSSRPPAVHKKNIIAVNQKSFISSLTELYYLIHDRIYNICYIQLIVVEGKQNISITTSIVKIHILDTYILYIYYKSDRHTAN